jgi:hypothetical protein
MYSAESSSFVAVTGGVSSGIAYRSRKYGEISPFTSSGILESFRVIWCIITHVLQHQTRHN